MEDSQAAVERVEVTEDLAKFVVHLVESPVDGVEPPVDVSEAPIDDDEALIDGGEVATQKLDELLVLAVGHARVRAGRRPSEQPDLYLR